MRWVIWNIKKSKIAHQIEELSEKFNSKLKSLKTEQEKMKEKIKVTLFWWKKKVIYDLKLIAQQLASTKISEQHQESEKSKKDWIQILSLNMSKILIN